MTNLDSIFKSRDITLPTKVRLVKVMVFPVVMYGCESWTVKKAERRRIDAFFFFNFYFYFILLYNTVLVLPYIDMNPPRVYMRSQTWTPLPPPSLQHPSGSSLCTSPKHAVSCVGHRLVIRFLHDSIHVSMPFLYSLSHHTSFIFFSGRILGK